MEKSAVCALCQTDKNVSTVEVAGKASPLCKGCVKDLLAVLESRGGALSKYVRRLAKDCR